MQYFDGTGRRKSSVARVRLTPGTGKRIINGKKITEVFSNIDQRIIVEEALKLVELTDKMDLKVNVFGGGITGQAGAISLGISRALLLYDEDLRATLKKEGLLRRDARVVERKKTGQPKARKKSQFSKR